MSSELQVDTDPATHELMESALETVLERRGFQVVFHLGGTPGRRVTEYKRSDDLVSIRSERQPEERRNLIVHSEQVNLDDLIAEAVELTATTLLGELLQPLVSGGKVSVPSLNRRVRRLVQDARGGRLSP